MVLIVSSSITFPMHHRKIKKEHERGFSALLSTIIISIVLFSSVFALAHMSVAGRFILLDVERKIQSERLADACAEIALIAIAGDPGYQLSGARVVSVYGYECTLLSIENDPANSTIARVSTFAERAGAITRYEFRVDRPTARFLEKREIRL